MMRALRRTAFIAMVFASGGCVAHPGLVEPITPPVSFTLPTVPAPLDNSGRTRVVRIRSTTCDSLGVGSGFLIGSDTLVTNRHVVEGSLRLEVDTWDGHHLSVGVASQATIADLAVIHIIGATGDVAPLAPTDPLPGDSVRAIGYPLGDQITATGGRVVDYVEDGRYGQVGKVMRTSTEISPGNSGGPLVDAAGNVVGVVFAIDTHDGSTLVIPVSRLHTALDTPGTFRPIVPCTP